MDSYFFATPDVQEGVQNSCSKCHVGFGLKFARTLYTIKNDVMDNNLEENTTVAKGVADFNTDIELVEWAPDFDRERLTVVQSLGVANTPYSKQL